MIDATMVASLIAPVPAPDIAFVCWCCCVVPSLWRKSLVSAKNNDQQTDDGRRNELVHLLGHPENCSTCCTVPQSTTVVYAQKLNRQNGIASERLIYVDTHDINNIQSVEFTKHTCIP